MGDRFGARSASSIGVCIAICVALAGCVPGAPAPTVSSSVSPSEAPSPSLPETTAPSSPSSQPPKPTAERVGGWPVETIEDLGSRDYAIGDVEYSSDGTPSAYVVGSGDLIEFVGERLGVSSAYLVIINQVRRGTTGVLWEGDVLNLDAHTITSVGTINGSVLHEDPPDPMPQQR